MLTLKNFITTKNKSCKVIISTITMRVDDQKCRLVVRKVNDFLKELNVLTIKDEIIQWNYTCY